MCTQMIPREIIAYNESEQQDELEEQRETVEQLEEELATLLEEESESTDETVSINFDHIINVDGEEIVTGTFGFSIRYVDENLNQDYTYSYIVENDQLTLYGRIDKETFEYIFTKQ